MNLKGETFNENKNKHVDLRFKLPFFNKEEHNFH